MLLLITTLVDFCALSITLWLALYLLGKSFPHPIAMRAIVMLLALSIFFFGAYINIFEQIEGTAAWRAVLLVIGLGTWYSLVCQLVSAKNRARLRWLEISIYLLGGVSILLLLVTQSAFIGEQGNHLYVAHMSMGLPYTIYGLFQILVSFGLLFNLLSGDRVGLTSLGRYFLLASIFPSLAVGYGVLGLISPMPLPRLFQDFLTFCGVFLVGAAVARHQAMVERRTALPDFPVTGGVILGLASVYAFFAWHLGFEPRTVALTMFLAIFTHALSDFAREALERLRIRQENTFRKKLHSLEAENLPGQSLNLRLKLSLGLLIQILKASGGLIALRQGDDFVVMTSQNSLPLETQLPAELVLAEDLLQPETEISGVSWLAPVFDNQIQVGVCGGLGKPSARLNYSADDLDLLAEVADRVGELILLNESQQHSAQASPANGQIRTEANADDLVLSIANNLETGFVKTVEESLRHLADYNLLGESPLAGQLGLQGESHLERGKTLHSSLLAAIETLRPAGARPRQPLPRVWYPYAVLHDAYVEEVPNREIMARLYISEGTFNRTRRNALRSLARLLLEKEKPSPGG